MDGIALPLALTAIFVAINGFFVGTEFALVKARKSRLMVLAKDGSKSAKKALQILDHLDLYLSGCQLGITVASLILGWLAEPAVARLLLMVFESLGIHLNESLAHVIALAVALTVVTMLHMVFGEQAPKILAIHKANRVSAITAYPLYIFVLFLRPLIWLINVLSNAVLRMIGVHAGASEDVTHDIEEIRSILVRSAEEGYLTSRQREFAHNILGLVDLQVRHILVPRIEVTLLSLKAGRDENLKVLRDSSHSRFPLCEDNLDSAIRIVHTKDVLTELLEERDPELSNLGREAVFVPETLPLSRFIVDMQSSRTGCAVVADEHGTAVGVAFLEDALEEIVGPISDEFDAEENGPENPEPGVFVFPGSTPLPEAKIILELDDLEGTDTIGGYVVAQLNRLPREGDVVTIGDYNVTVETVKHRCASRLKVVLKSDRKVEEESKDEPAEKEDSAD